MRTRYSYADRCCLIVDREEFKRRILVLAAVRVSLISLLDLSLRMGRGLLTFEKFLQIPAIIC